MGWCQAFGPQIREGCDHAMVADRDSCSCPECGVVCPGKFAGCTMVWAAGPQNVTLRRPSATQADPVRYGLPQLAAPRTTNGNGASPALDRPVVAIGAPPPQPEMQGDLRALLRALHAEVQVLSRKIDQLSHTAQADENAAHAANRAILVAEGIPNRIASAVADAIREQHQAILGEIDQMQDQLLANAEIPEAALSSFEASLIERVDAHFEWLVGELSERFVVLGNALARIERTLGEPSRLNSIGVAEVQKAMAPILGEVDRLARALDSSASGVRPTPIERRS